MFPIIPSEPLLWGLVVGMKSGLCRPALSLPLQKTQLCTCSVLLGTRYCPGEREQGPCPGGAVSLGRETGESAANTAQCGTCCARDEPQAREQPGMCTEQELVRAAFVLGGQGECGALQQPAAGWGAGAPPFCDL